MFIKARNQAIILSSSKFIKLLLLLIAFSQIFKKWKEEKDEDIITKKKREKKDSTIKLSDKQEIEDQKKKDAEGAFVGW